MRKRVFHGWRMVAAGGGIQFLQAGLLHQAFGAYFAVLTAEFGWSKTALSGAAALQPMEAAVLGPALGWIIDRFGTPVVVRTGVTLLELDLGQAAYANPMTYRASDGTQYVAIATGAGTTSRLVVLSLPE